MKYLSGLTYESEPNYSYLYELIEKQKKKIEDDHKNSGKENLSI